MDAKVQQDTEQLREDLIESARELVPILRERAAAAEANRRVEDATHQAFVDAGFIRFSNPAVMAAIKWILV